MTVAPTSPSFDNTARGGASLRIDDLVKHYPGARHAAVDHVSLDIAAGELVSLLGASGSGKTTTLMMIAGFTPPDAGEIVLADRPVAHLPPERRGIGVVFQNYALFPHMSALRNVAFPLRMRGVPAAQRNQQAAATLERVGLSGLGHRLPAELSGGQQQRVALARAIVFQPGLLLMDEPLGALDRALREHMKGEIRRLHRELGITVLYVTHDQEEALTLSDRIALMHQGRIVQIGSGSDLYERPSSAYVAAFIGESTILEGTVDAPAGGVCALRLPGFATPLHGSGRVAASAPAVLVLRPEKVRIVPADAGPGLEARVADLVYIGDATRVVLRLGDAVSIAAKLANRGDVYRPALGDTVRVSWDATDALILPSHNPRKT